MEKTPKFIAVDTGKFAYIGISTKGGMNGEGAQASIASIFQFMVDDYPTGKMHPFGKQIFPINSNGKPVYKTAKELDKMLRQIDPKSRHGLTFWEVAIDEWNRNNSDKELPLDLEQPNYCTLK